MEEIQEIMRKAIEREADRFIDALHKMWLIPPDNVGKEDLTWFDNDGWYGWYVIVAKLREGRPTIAIWYDNTLDSEAPAFWVGFGAGDRTNVEHLLRDCRSKYPSPVELTKNDYVRDEQQWHLRDEALNVVLAHPVTEFDEEFDEENELNGFGVYGEQAEPGRATLELPRALDFVEQVLRSLPEFRATDMEADFQEIRSNSEIPSTTGEALIDTRRGQDKFRADLDRVWDNKCAVLGYSTRELLRASHIKPWSDSRDSENCHQERRDPNNGLLLAAHLDALFDTGLISFRGDGSMMISSEINEFDRKHLNLGGKKLRITPWAELNAYLADHRKRFRSPEA